VEQAILVPVAWNLLCPHCRKPLMNPDDMRTWGIEDIEYVSPGPLVCVGCEQSCAVIYAHSDLVDGVD
jgi:hypothetical protein